MSVTRQFEHHPAQSIKHTFCFPLLFCFSYMVVLDGVCGFESVAEDGSLQDLSGVERFEDHPIADFQKELLSLAMEAADKIPLQPHIKDRSRTQESVIQACLSLHQPVRALQYCEKIANWRRASCYADIAMYSIQNGLEDAARPLIEKARSAIKEEEDWRNDRVKVKLAQAFVLLGETAQAASDVAHLVDSERGKVEAALIQSSTEESYPDQIQALDQLIAPGVFDSVKNALFSYVELYDRFFQDKEKTIEIEEKIKSSWAEMPVIIRIELLHRLSNKALFHRDLSEAERLISEADHLIQGYHWPLEHQISLWAASAKLHDQVGKKDSTKKQLDAARALYQEHGKQIVNIRRADTLIPLAEAYAFIHEKEKALAIYRLAVEEGNVNPNSRPRAEDISATCVSMALSEVEPDEALWARIRNRVRGLSDPW